MELKLQRILRGLSTMDFSYIPGHTHFSNYRLLVLLTIIACHHGWTCVLMKSAANLPDRLDTPVLGLFWRALCCRSSRLTCKLQRFFHFRGVCKIAKSDYNLRHVYLSVPVEKLGCQWADFHEISYWLLFENLSVKLRFHHNLARITGSLYNDPSTFMISRPVLPRMRNVSNL